MTATETCTKNLCMTWTTERVAMLRTCLSAGLTCGQIAREIGVSRNAVIGKVNRLGLSRGRSATGSGTRVAVSRRRPHVLTQRFGLEVMFSPEHVREDVVSAEPCSLLNLAPQKCRWPISAAGTANLSFCGNITAGGMSYCIGHARMAYRTLPRAWSG
jgi:GcrA cell cycle regulator